MGDLSKSPDCECLLNDLVSECGGLPLVINTIAAALKDEPLFKWKNILNEMKKSAPEKYWQYDQRGICEFEDELQFLK